MTKPDDRVPDEVLQVYLKIYGKSDPRHLIAQELLERRRGEWICPQCGLRNAGNAKPEQDSDGGLPW